MPPCLPPVYAYAQMLVFNIDDITAAIDCFVIAAAIFAIIFASDFRRYADDDAIFAFDFFFAAFRLRHAAFMPFAIFRCFSPDALLLFFSVDFLSLRFAAFADAHALPP